jgi:hypothetical protein
LRHCRYASLDRAGEAFGKIGVTHEFYIQAAQGFLDLIGLVAGDDDHALGL